jgi:diphthine methyl ester synthase
MPLYIIGLGLGDDKDITVKGRECIEKCDKIFLEVYTSVLGVSRERLEEVYGKKIEYAYRDTVESYSNQILDPAKTLNVAFLVVGDPFGATTHTDLLIRSNSLGIKTSVIHNASIMNAIGICGLQLYSFGQTISIPFFTDEWKPESFYDKLAFNLSGSLHTLALLDIKVREPNFDLLTKKGILQYNPPKFMTINEAILQLFYIEERRKLGICLPESFGIGVARVGQDSATIISGTLLELSKLDFGPPLHSLIICGKMHDLELEMFEFYRYNPSKQEYKEWVPTVTSKTDSDDEASE